MDLTGFIESVSGVSDADALCEAYLTKVVEITGLRGFLHLNGTVVSIWDPRPKTFKDLDIGSSDLGGVHQRPQALVVPIATGLMLVLSNSSKTPNSSVVQAISGVTAVTRVLYDKICAIQETQRVHETLLSCVSHELRTPLNGIIGLTRVMKAQLPEGEMRTYAGVTHTCGMQLVAIINDLLDHSRLQTNQLTLVPKPTSVDRCIRDSIDIVRTRFPSAKFAVRQLVRLDDTACLDEYRLKQIIVNLLVNSAKYSETEPQISVRIGGSDHVVEIDIADNGIGIPPEKHEQIFEAFARVPTTTNVEGTGLGLFISRRIARLMGGDVRVKQSDSKGTTMSVTVLRRMPSKPASVFEQHSTRSAGVTEQSHDEYLVVDDIAYNSTVLVSILRELRPGCSVHVVDSGLQAVSRCSAHSYNVVFMDIRMPGKLDGYATTRAILDLYRFRGCPAPKIVAVSAYVGQDDIDRCQRCGMAGFVSKPVEPSEIETFL